MTSAQICIMIAIIVYLIGMIYICLLYTSDAADD